MVEAPANAALPSTILFVSGVQRCCCVEGRRSDRCCITRPLSAFSVVWTGAYQLQQTLEVAAVVCRAYIAEAPGHLNNCCCSSLGLRPLRVVEQYCTGVTCPIWDYLLLLPLLLLPKKNEDRRDSLEASECLVLSPLPRSPTNKHSATTDSRTRGGGSTAAAAAAPMVLGAACAAAKEERYVRVQKEQLQISGSCEKTRCRKYAAAAAAWDTSVRLRRAGIPLRAKSQLPLRNARAVMVWINVWYTSSGACSGVYQHKCGQSGDTYPHPLAPFTPFNFNKIYGCATSSLLFLSRPPGPLKKMPINRHRHSSRRQNP